MSRKSKANISPEFIGNKDGKPKRKRAMTESEIMARPKTEFDVIKWYPKTPPDGGLYQSVYEDRVGEGTSQIAATKALFKQMGLPMQGTDLDKFLATIPECQEKTILVNVLEEQ